MSRREPQVYLAALALGTTVWGSVVTPTWAVSRSCSADAVANTNNVLCASPSGPCNGTSVTMSASIEVTAGGCEFDLGNRALTVQKTLQMTGLGFVKMRNASSITVTSSGKLKARGDFVEPNGFIVPGGLISLESAGTITSGGIIDVSGDPAGSVLIAGGGGVTLQSGSLVQGNGMTSFVTDGNRFSDGGDVEISSAAGTVTINDNVNVTGTRHGAGGIIFVQGARTVGVAGTLDASGGESDGGDVTVISGDDITVTKPINVESAGGGGFGGEIDLLAGVDSLGGVAVGGGVTVTGVDLKLNGSVQQGSGGDGGALFMSAGGLVRFTGTGVGIHASAGTSGDAFGGSVIIDTTDLDDTTIGALDGDISVDGTVVLQGGGTGGVGGEVALFAGKSLTMNATINVTGEESGGDVVGQAGAGIAVNNIISAQATNALGSGGSVDLRAGFAQNASLTVTKDIVASSGANSNVAQTIVLSACSMAIGTNVKLDGRAGTGGGALIQLLSRTAMQLYANSQYLAGPAGRIETIHPPGQNPNLGSGVVFNPARVDIATTDAVYQPCP